MKLVIDAMGSDSGGIRTYVEQLLAAWTVARPDDELHVLVAEGSTVDVGSHRRHELAVGSPMVLRRPVVLTRAVDRVVADTGAEAVLATLPTTTLRAPRVPLVVVVHDLRHEIRPEQFPLSRRFLRRVSYTRGYALADAFLGISRRTLDDLHRLHPATATVRSAVVHHGADHALTWPAPDRSGPSVAFAHHTNKRADLVLAAWREMVDRGAAGPLMIVGVPAHLRDGMAADVRRLGLEASVTLAPYLDDEQFTAVVSSAHCFVFPSDFEGFGLPVVEAMILGKPVVIAPDPACVEVGGGHAVVADSWTAADLADAVMRAQAMGVEDLESARVHAAGFTWHQTVERTAALVGAAIGSSSSSGA